MIVFIQSNLIGGPKLLRLCLLMWRFLQMVCRSNQSCANAITKYSAFMASQLGKPLPQGQERVF